MIIVTERKLNIPRSDIEVGCAGDNLVEIRNFELSRFYGDIDLSLFDFKLDTQVGNVKNIIDLSKVVAEETITLTWTIEESHVLYSGYMAIQVRAFHGEVEKWHSAQGYVLVMPSINPADAQPDVLPSEFEQMEVRLTALANSAETDAETATTQAGTAATKAQEASGSAAAALASEQAAKTSENEAKGYTEAAEGFAVEAAASALQAKNAVKGVEEMAVQAHTLAPGADATATTEWGSGKLLVDIGVPRGDKGAPGDTGPQGPQGETGPAATVAVGTVTTLDAGESATVANSGTSGAAVLDFGLPQGAKGDPGSDANVTADNITAALGYNPANVGVVSPWYEGVDLTQKFAAEIAGHSDVWAWSKARIMAHDYTGIHVNDYIPFTTTNNIVVKACVAGIDTYYCYGNGPVGHHIDFISRDCWPTTVQMNKTNYNNGLIPVEKLSGDGTTTAFVMTRQMTAINNITVDGTRVTEFTYDFATSTVTFDAAPASGSNNIIVTGTGTRHPWLASNAYAYLNSLAMQVPNGTGANPAITQVDYTADGVYYYLPAALKSVIVDKRIMLPTRYSATGSLTTDNNWAWANMGKLWLPSEVEIAGCPIWGDKGGGAGGFVQYPVFACNMNRLKGLGNGGSRSDWWAISAHSGSSTYFAGVAGTGHVNPNGASYACGAPVCFRIS